MRDLARQAPGAPSEQLPKARLGALESVGYLSSARVLLLAGHTTDSYGRPTAL